MKRFAIVCFIAFLSMAPAQSGRPLPEFRLRFEPDNQRISVRMEVDLPAPGSLHLLFRGRWGGYPGLEGRLQRVQAVGPRGPLSVEAVEGDPAWLHRVLKVDRPGLVTVTYTVALSPPAEARFYHRVSQFSEAGGHLIGGDLFPRVGLDRKPSGRQPAKIWFFSGMPPDWRVVTVADRAGGAYTVDDVRSAVFMVGPLRSQRLAIGPRSLTTVTLGHWPVADERLIDAVNHIAGGLHLIARDAWQAGHYMYAAGKVPSRIPGWTAGGQVIGASAVVYVGGGGSATDQFDRWMATTAHEVMHWYIPETFRFSGAPPAWFAEGFTDYFAAKTLLAGELIEPDMFFRRMGRLLSRYRSSPLFGVRSIAEAEADFWEDNTYRYIYDGGAAAAFLLDLGFQAGGRSLERALSEARRTLPVTASSLASALSTVRENRWIGDWIAGTADPDWDAELERYGLVWKNGDLVTVDDWATEMLRTIRP